MREHAYVVRFGWTGRDLLLVPLGLLTVVGGASMAVTGRPVLGALALVLGAGYIAPLMLAWLGRRVAFAVTAEGITLGRLPPWPASRTALVPWSDVEAFVLWGKTTGQVTRRYVGVERRLGAPPLPGSAKSPRLRRLNKAFARTSLPEGLVADSRQVAFWRLDKARLAAALKHFAPHVPLMDRT